MHSFKKPDLNAPRFRPESHSVVNRDFCNRFRKENPRYADLDNDTIKQIINAINGKIWEMVIEERQGVELPEQLGYLFIGSCPRMYGSNPDMKVSENLGQTIQHRNWESDQYVAKIFYTNYETKYSFKNRELWGFSGVRQFTRAVAHSYPTEFKKYIVVDNTLKISRMFRSEKKRAYKRQKTQETLQTYNEFEV
jgi:hypothetical protein